MGGYSSRGNGVNNRGENTCIETVLGKKVDGYAENWPCKMCTRNEDRLVSGNTKIWRAILLRNSIRPIKTYDDFIIK